VIDCPVCPRQDIPSGQLTCDNCGVDLQPVWRVRELADYRYNEALELLSDGDADRALEKLCAARESGGEPGRCRLLAGKILWQLGRTAGAVREWRLVPSSDPLHAESNRLADMAEATVRRRSAVRVGVVAAAAVVILAIPASLLLRPGRSPQPAAGGTVIDSTAPAEVPGRAAGAENLNAVPAQDEATGLEGLVSRLNELSVVRAEQDEAGLRVVFVDGLFGSGADVPSEAGYVALGQVVRTIASYGESLSVEVLGVTDNTPVRPGGGWTDNWSLALSRAHSAVQFMRVETASPQVFWLAASSGVAGTPFSNDTEANRAKNRTVVLSVRR